MSSYDTSDIDAFIAYLQFEKRYSKLTSRAYRDDLHAFATFFKDQFNEVAIASATQVAIRSWLAYQRDAGMQPRSLHRKLSSLKSFFKFMMRQGRLKANPAATLTAPKMNKRLPVFVAEQAMQDLFSGIVFPEGWEGILHETVLKLFYATGMRLSELVHLKMSQIDFGKQHIKILGKGNKERVIPFTADLSAVLQRYVQERSKQKEIEAVSPFFVREDGKALTPRSIQYFVKKYLAQVTTLERKSPHVLRHSFATHLMNHGADLNAVKELLGHSSLASTQVYTHTTIEQLKAIHAKAHPRS